MWTENKKEAKQVDDVQHLGRSVGRRSRDDGWTDSVRVMGCCCRDGDRSRSQWAGWMDGWRRGGGGVSVLVYVMAHLAAAEWRLLLSKPHTLLYLPARRSSLQSLPRITFRPSEAANFPAAKKTLDACLRPIKYLQAHVPERIFKNMKGRIPRSWRNFHWSYLIFTHQHSCVFSCLHVVTGATSQSPD